MKGNAASAEIVQGMTAATVKVLWCLFMHANENGLTWPCIEKIAKTTGIVRGNVVRGLADLANRGIIENTGKRTRHGVMIRCIIAPQLMRRTTGSPIGAPQAPHL